MSGLSSDRALEDFLRQCLRHPIRVMLERLYLPAEVVWAREFQAESDRLLAEMKAPAGREAA